MLQGKWILRFDDTNPNTCTADNVEAYMQVRRMRSWKPALWHP